MTVPLPSADLPWDLFADRELSNEAKWYARFFQWLNGLRDTTEPFLTVWKARAATTATSLGASTWTKIALDTIEIDPLGLGITSGGFAAPAAGIYQVVGSAGVNVASGNRRGAQVGKNSTLVVEGSQNVWKVTASAEAVCSGQTFVSLAAGDQLHIYGFQDTASPVNTIISDVTRQSTLTVLRLS